MTGKHKDNFNANYLQYVKTQEPKTKHFKNCLAAFGVGGLICCIGQFFRFMLEYAGLSGDVLAGTVSAILIFLSCLLTGFGVYDRIGRHAGAGSIVPITGFANSVASPAIEFKTEGWIYGMAAKMFTVAGPIIVFGVFSGVLVGLIYSFI
ncbi:MAG: stage V sporulation protein AC [Clostridia bacterium]|nr:stage V sporulation protein AC [Clostridia bacterium]